MLTDRVDALILEFVQENTRWAVDGPQYRRLRQLTDQAVAEAVAAELEARPNLLQEDEIVTIVNRKVAEDWAQFSDGKPPKVLAPQVRHIIAAWAAIRARDGGETSNTD